MAITEDAITPIVILGTNGASYKGKGKGAHEYAADEDLYGYRGSYAQPPNLNGGRNPSGGGDDPK